MREFDAVNILLRLRRAQADFDIVVVDGFGPLATGAKNSLRLKFRVLSRMKARKSWKNQISLLDAWAGRILNPERDSGLVGP